jgi:hypothetical protein
MNSNTLLYYDRVVHLSMGSLRRTVSDGRWQSRAVGDFGPGERRRRITVNQSVWNGKVGTPKNQDSRREIAISGVLRVLLKHQRTGKTFLFETESGKPWDQNGVRKRLQRVLRALGIKPAGLHAFRHFNASLMDQLRIPLKLRQERLGHASTGSLTLDVYTQTSWEEDYEAAEAIDAAIEKAVNSVSLTAAEEKGPAGGVQQALTTQHESGCGGPQRTQNSIHSLPF